jgi:hypothetical protein
VKRAALLAWVAALLAAAPLARAAEAGIRVDRQAYAATTPVDQCGETTTAICVGAAGGTATMVAFVHLDLKNMPRAAHLSLREDGSSANVNADSASMQVCVLTVELGASFDAQNPPPYDCTLARSPARRGTDGLWSADLMPLVRVWSRIGNTGAALVAQFANVTSSPAVPEPGVWSLSFDKSRTAATGEFAPAAAAPPPVSDERDAVTAVSGEPAIVANAVPPPPAASVPRALTAALLVAEPVAASPPAPVASVPGRLEAAWLLAMLALVFGCVGLLAGETARRLEPSARTSPRAIAAAAAQARSHLAAPLALLAGMALVTLGAMLRR